ITAGGTARWRSRAIYKTAGGRSTVDDGEGGSRRPRRGAPTRSGIPGDLVVEPPAGRRRKTLGPAHQLPAQRARGHIQDRLPVLSQRRAPLGIRRTAIRRALYGVPQDRRGRQAGDQEGRRV